MNALELIKDAVFLIGVGVAVPIWIICQIRKGQKESMEDFASRLAAMRKEFRRDRKKLSHRLNDKVSRAECAELRAKCPCNNNR